MDKSWMQLGKCHPEFKRGCDEFIDYAWSHRTPDLGECIFFPCLRCNNVNCLGRDVVREHIRENGITHSYTRWTKHGEPEELANNIGEEVSNVIGGGDMHGMLQAAFPESRFFSRDGEVPDQANTNGSSQDDRVPEEPNAEAQKFYKLLKDAETPLFPGCTTHSKLSFIVSLLHHKCTWKECVKIDACPNDCMLYWKENRDLGMECVKIDACPNDCMLYWKENRDKVKCDHCDASRWISDTSQSGVKRKAAKVLRWFPLIPRLQRYYMDPKTAKDMIWHDKVRSKDGVLRHPADSKCWKKLDEKHPVFGSERRNVRLGLASDGFNPFGVMGTGHSTRPVFVTSYNLPPDKCMKQPYFIMCLLIPGPKGPGNNIDVYLQPLIEELKELWENGIETYDAHSKQNFQMRAALLCTINDFPAYANLSGWI